VLFFLLFVRLGYSLQHSLAATLLIACASILFPYSKIIHSEIVATLCLLIFLNMVARHCLLTLKNGFALGCIVSALYLLKIGNMPLAVIVASYAVIRIIQRKATIAGAFTFSLASTIPFLLMLVSNNNDYGSFSNFGYGAEQRQFTTPIANGLAGFFFSPSKSLLLFSPLIIIWEPLKIHKKLKNGLLLTKETL
jgi:hypothetical protein